MQRIQLNVEQLLDIADRGNADRHVGNQQREAIGVVGDVVTGLAEGVLGVSAHAPRFSAEHPASCKGIGQCQ
ncbi:hypothetical protein D3C76_1589060 [compost metagenome]